MFTMPPDADTLSRMRERVRVIDLRTALDWYETGTGVFVDVREPYEFAQGHIPGAILRPLSAFDPDELPAVPPGRALVLHCAVGVRCGHAAMALIRAGHPGPIHRIEGGFMAWQGAGGPFNTGSWDEPQPRKTGP